MEHRLFRGYITSFKDLPVGEEFIYSGHVYIKVDTYETNWSFVFNAYRKENDKIFFIRLYNNDSVLAVLKESNNGKD